MDRGTDLQRQQMLATASDVIKDAHAAGVCFVIDEVTKGLGIAGHKKLVDEAHAILMGYPELREPILEVLRQEDPGVAAARKVLALELARETGSL